MMYWLLTIAQRLALTNCPPGDTRPECDTNFPIVGASGDTLKPILQIVFGVIGLLTVIFIIIAAIRYATTLGNPEATAKLRNTIIWASIGLIITLSAEALVTFVLGKV